MKLLLIFYILLLTALLTPLFADAPITLIENYEFGVLPTNVDLHMVHEDYAFTMAMLGITSAFAFWIGWNNHT